MEIFTAVDFMVFAAALLISVSIGIFFACRDRNKTTSDNYFFAGRKSSPVAVGMSMAATYLSAFALVAVPAEVYMVGTAFVSYAIAIPLATLISTIYFVPYFHRLELSSIYQYLELRFNRASRFFSAFLVTLSMVFYAGMGIYLPALAVSAVAPISLTTSIVVTGIVCTFYTTLGGMKAVIWTDMIQAVIMMAGGLAVCLRTFSVVGGLQNVTEALDHGMRFTASEWNFDVTSRSSTFAVGLGPFLANVYLTAFTQPAIQRYKSCRSTKHACWAMIISIPPIIVVTSLGVLNGLLMYAYFDGCDPVKSGLMKSMDQGMPYIAMKVFRDIPGAAGLFVASIYCASLSTVSSIINSMAMVVLEDFIPQKLSMVSERSKLLLGKFVVSVFGATAIGIAFLFSIMKSNIMRLFLSLMSTLSGPLLGMFLCGLFLPWVNAVGVICGGAISFLLLMWITVGSIFFKTLSLHSPLPTFMDRCPIDNSTAPIGGFNISSSNTTIATAAVAETYPIDQVAYNLSYFYYTPFGVAISILVAVVVSFIAGANSPSASDPRLFIPLIDSKIFPKKVRFFFRFGVPKMDTSETKGDETT